MEEETGGILAEAAAIALSSLDGFAGVLEDLGLEMYRQWRYISDASEGGWLGPLFRFFRSVDWTEPWMLVLMTFHTVLLTMAVRSRKNNSMQMSIFTFGVLCVYFAERVNSLLARNWERFFRRPYFDREGVLVSTVWSGPLLVIGTVILANTLYTLVNLVIEWKRAERRHRAYLAGKQFN